MLLITMRVFMNTTSTSLIMHDEYRLDVFLDQRTYGIEKNLREKHGKDFLFSERLKSLCEIKNSLVELKSSVFNLYRLKNLQVDIQENYNHLSGSVAQRVYELYEKVKKNKFESVTKDDLSFLQDPTVWNIWSEIDNRDPRSWVIPLPYEIMNLEIDEVRFVNDNAYKNRTFHHIMDLHDRCKKDSDETLKGVEKIEQNKKLSNQIVETRNQILNIYKKKVTKIKTSQEKKETETVRIYSHNSVDYIFDKSGNLLAWLKDGVLYIWDAVKYAACLAKDKSLQAYVYSLEKVKCLSVESFNYSKVFVNKVWEKREDVWNYSARILNVSFNNIPVITAGVASAYFISEYFTN